MTIQADLPEQFRIQCKIIGDPLEGLPELDPNPPAFRLTEQYTAERHARIRADHEKFLWPAELDLLDNFMCKQNAAFAWKDSKCISFHRDMLKPIRILASNTSYGLSIKAAMGMMGRLHASLASGRSVGACRALRRGGEGAVLEPRQAPAGAGARAASHPEPARCG